MVAHMHHAAIWLIPATRLISISISIRLGNERKKKK